MAKGPTESFEIPNELRNVAEQSVAQARQAFDGLMTAVHKAASKLEEQAVSAQAGAKGASDKVMSFAERTSPPRSISPSVSPGRKTWRR